MNKETSDGNLANDYFHAKELFGSRSGFGGVQISEDDPLEATRRLMPAFMEAKWSRRTKLGYPLTIINRKAWADPVTREEFYSPALLPDGRAKIIEECTEIKLKGWKPTTENPNPPTKTFGLVRTEDDRAKWVEVVENAKKEE